MGCRDPDQSRRISSALGGWTPPARSFSRRLVLINSRGLGVPARRGPSPVWPWPPRTTTSVVPCSNRHPIRPTSTLDLTPPPTFALRRGPHVGRGRGSSDRGEALSTDTTGLCRDSSDGSSV